MGISGANIAVAETGSLVIVTNEGNARLVTTLPKIHVAIVGIEKLVATFDDIAPILTALPAQRHGPAADQLRVHHHRARRPTPTARTKELHIILMDNQPHGDGGATRSSSRPCSASAAPPA